MKAGNAISAFLSSCFIFMLGVSFNTALGMKPSDNPTTALTEMNTTLLVELRSIFQMKLPANMNSLLKGAAYCLCTAQQAEKTLFDEIKQYPALEKQAEPTGSHYYPQIIQKWLTNKLTTEQIKKSINSQASWLTWHTPFFYKVDAAFTPGCAAEALTPHEPTLKMLMRCITQKIVCADFNSAEFDILSKKHPKVFGLEGAFPPTRTYISGDCEKLMSQPEFFEEITTKFTKQKAEKRIFFISSNREAITTAEQNKIISVYYNCSEAANTHALERFLQEQNILKK